jgi:hypothetical protein
MRRKVSPLQIARIETRPNDFDQDFADALKSEVHIVHIQERVSFLMNGNNTIKRKEESNHFVKQ